MVTSLGEKTQLPISRRTQIERFPVGVVMRSDDEELKDNRERGSAEAGTRTPMSVRSLRPESNDAFWQSRAMLAFGGISSKGGVAGIV